MSLDPGSSAESAGENGSSNGNSPSPPPDSAAQVPARRLSGFADPAYWTPEKREAQRQMARKLHEEGRLGGRQPGAGRPRTKTVAEVVSETAQQKSDVIARKLMEMVNHKSPSISLGAIDRIHTFEQAVQKNMRDDEKEILKLSGKSLDQALADVLSEHGVEYDYELSDSEIEEDGSED